MKRASLGLIAAFVVTSAGAAAAAPRLTKGPYLTALSDTGVEVRFELDAPAAADVELKAGEGRGDGAAPRTVADGPAAMHVVTVAGLAPATAYDYAVRAGGAVLGAGHFITAPAAGSPAPVTFLVYGDTRSSDTTQAALVRLMLATPSDFLVNTGDIVATGGSASDWQDFFRIEQPLLRDRALFLAIGNHELSDDQAGASFARYFGFTGAADAGATARPYGTMRWGSARLFFLNGMHDWSRGEEREWLDRELARADAEPGLEWRIVVLHHSPWSSGPHGGNQRLLDANIPEILAAHGVDLLLAGHDHIYERGEHGGDAALKYVISGGGGAPLYPIEHRLASTRKAESVYHFVEIKLTGDTLRMVAHRIDGTILDTCGFQKRHPWECDPAPKAETPVGVAAPPADDAGGGKSSRCGCAVPGGAGPAWGALVVVAGVVAAGMRRSRRRRG
ncbi:MAG TPA: metallophosphoesterase [Polyangiaceae bacterium]|jgi:MYXO-CTERM domain-containing protein|nr:metallophosphoesterase [Polyangiaceae bacterium]